jgi:hypothetical protein
MPFPKPIHRTWRICLLGSLRWDVSGFIKSRLVQTDLWDAIRLALLRKVLLRSVVLTTRRLLPLSLDWPLLDHCLQLLLSIIGSYFRWMLKMPSSTVILWKKSICILHLSFIIRHTRFVDFVGHFMVSSRLLVLGSPSLVMWLLNKALSLVHITQLFFFELLMLVLFLYFFMLTIRLLLGWHFRHT